VVGAGNQPANQQRESSNAPHHTTAPVQITAENIFHGKRLALLCAPANPAPVSRMKVFDFKSELWLPTAIERVFAFFANAQNLEAITPAWLRFRILTPLPIEMRTGTLIDYQLRIHGLPIRWRTEITAWQPPHRFVDEQKRGPYRLWIHEHRFEPKDNGTLCSDHVRYAAPGGALVHRWLVRPDVERIFAFRATKLAELLKP
jgi:ligand-binding SRPBCC domain-containing protein